MNQRLGHCELKIPYGDFPGGPVAKTLSYRCRGTGILKLKFQYFGHLMHSQRERFRARNQELEAVSCVPPSATLHGPEDRAEDTRV